MSHPPFSQIAYTLFHLDYLHPMATHKEADMYMTPSSESNLRLEAKKTSLIIHLNKMSCFATLQKGKKNHINV